ncbi:outer membrane beta-barrel protein [Microbacter margulisiae]|uniref:Outer membrane protein beta-barrel domain-containing protein n=1 Tax=Microbacter margulisiae TaxID=1350067 RepID=A0A7W5DMV1_9PORP|nr:outer membrane beta-barrel protein [Microbacter margulisiae]MBB3185847.1 hypothetical protein [Microbacter margulisiae]
MANLNDKELRELFSQKFDNYNVTLPENDWETLQMKWNANKVNRRRFIGYWIAAASMVGILLCGFGIWLFQSGNQQQLSPLAQSTGVSSVSSTKIVTNKSISINNKSHTNAVTISKQALKKSIDSNKAQSLQATQRTTCNSSLLTAFNKINPPTSEVRDDAYELNVATISSVNNQVQSTMNNDSVTKYASLEVLPTPNAIPKNSKDQTQGQSKHQTIGWLAVHVQGNNGIPNNFSNNNAWMQPATLDYRLFTQVNKNTTPSANSSTQMITFIDKKTYAFPISWGLSFSIPLAQGWELQTGGLFTQLVTTGEVTSTTSTSATGRIEQNYIGIPVNIAYLFLNRPSFSVYGTAGGTIEKGVSLIEKIYSYNVQNIAQEQDHYSTTINGLQYSVDGNIGASYRIYKFIFGYMETGVAYYIPSNQPESYRTAHPVTITLKFGIRFTLGKASK